VQLVGINKELATTSRRLAEATKYTTKVHLAYRKRFRVMG